MMFSKPKWNYRQDCERQQADIVLTVAADLRQTYLKFKSIKKLSLKWCIAPRSRDKPAPDQRSHTLDGIGTDCDVLVPIQA